MNQVTFSDAHTLSVWIYCLAVLHSPSPVEEKIATIEQALLSKVLDSAIPVSIPQTGLEAFDSAAVQYSQGVETRLRALDLTAISTGSPLMDNAFRERIQKTIDINFSPLQE